MKIPKLNLWVVLAVVAIVAVVYFTYNTIQQHQYSGETLNFTTSGIVTVDHSSAEFLTVVAVSPRTFNIMTNDPAHRSLRPTREGSGSNARYIVETQLSISGTLEMNVNRGSGVEFTIVNSESSSLQAIVAARPANENRDIILFSIVICLGLIAFISYQTEHYLLKQIVARLPKTPRQRRLGASPA